MNKNWIDEIVEECDAVETPRSWLFWSLVCAISAAAGNNYHLKAVQGKVTYKPNLFVILLGESGLGKGFGINLSKKLVDLADVTRVFSGTSSIQGIIEELGQTASRNGKEPILDSRCFLVAGELSTALITDQLSLTTMTDLYDGHWNEKWAKVLKAGKVKLKEPYVTWLAGSSPSHFYDSIPQVNIEGGLIGRTLTVVEDKRAKDTDLLDDDDNIKDFPFEKYVTHLELINRGSGRFIPSDDAKNMFNSWRKEWRENQEQDVTGFLNRVPDHVLKVAMCLSLAEPTISLMINTDHIIQSIDRVTKLVYSNKKVSKGVGPDPTAPQSKMVIDFLLQAEGNRLFRKQLLNKGYGHYNSQTLDQIINDLIELGWVQRERYIAGPKTDWIIQLIGRPLADYKEFVTGREETQMKVFKMRV